MSLGVFIVSMFCLFLKFCICTVVISVSGVIDLGNLSLGIRALFLGGYYDVDDVVSEYRDWLSWIFYVICIRFNFSKGDYEYAFFSWFEAW